MSEQFPPLPMSEALPSRSASEPLVDSTALEFFNSLSGWLEIDLTEPAQPIGGGLGSRCWVLNLAAAKTAKIISLRLLAEVCNYETETRRPLTEDELNRVVFLSSTIRLCGQSGEPVSHSAPDGQRFTVRALLQAVEFTERCTRGTTEWFGGVDVHHIYFEGIHRTDSDIWQIYWGS